VATLFLVAGGLSLVSSLLLSLWWQHQLALALEVRPPVLLIDLTTAARGVDAAALSQILRDASRTAERLAANGVLVLERHAALAAPSGLVIPMQERAHEPE